MSRIPGITWYQTKDRVLVNLDLNEQVTSSRDYKLKVEGDTLEFTYRDYHLNTQLLNPVKLVESRDNGRSVKIVLEKDLTASTFWNYLSVNRAFNKSHVKIDWNNWVDEDEEPYQAETPTNPEDQGISLSMEEMMQMGGPEGLDLQKLMKMGNPDNIEGLEGIKGLEHMTSPVENSETSSPTTPSESKQEDDDEEEEEEKQEEVSATTN